MSPEDRLFCQLSPGALWLCAGLAVMGLPALWDVWQAGAAADVGSQVPFVALSALFLIWRDRRYLTLRAAGPVFPVAWGFALCLPAYVVARITGFVVMEYLALWATCLVLCRIEMGGAVLRRFWFVSLYLLFLATPSNRIVLWLTKPLKLWLTQTSVSIASLTGLDVGATGAIIQVDGYQLMVSTACSGVNSLIGIAAISLFYVYYRRGAQPGFALLLCVLLLPVAALANLLRILALIGATHFFGDAAVDSLFHPIAGLMVFALAVLVLFLLDSVLHPLLGKLPWR